MHTSDGRLKKDVNRVQGALDKVSRLNGVTWTWKDARRPGKQMGVVAQNVEQVAPELISEHSGLKHVNYEGLNALTIEAIKELSAKVAQLEAELKSCRK